MQQLSNLLESKFEVIDINLNNAKWHLDIPNTSGWYFIETNAPNEVLGALAAPPSEYKNDEGEQKKCRNYNISSRAKSLLQGNKSGGIVIGSTSIRVVYSGMAKNLLNRAREHTFSHPGTAGLALANYQVLKQYCWTFNYLPNTINSVSKTHKIVTLKLGEQMWRASNGWPILCKS
jgi:hypothetical protein